MKTNIMPPPTSKRRSERDEKESENIGGVYARKMKRYYSLLLYLHCFIYKYKNHFNEMKGDVR